MSVKNKIKKLDRSLNKRKGKCVLCGERVDDSSEYIEVKEGYCHRDCIITNQNSENAVEA